MTTPEICVRPASEDDAARLAEVHVAAWRATYRGVMTDEYLDGLDVGRAASAWRRNIREPGDGTVHLVVHPARCKRTVRSLGHTIGSF